MSGDSGSSKGTLLLNNVAKAKRSQVTAACQNCRRKKVKCDGRRPCSDCSRRGIHCEYVAQENETPQQALKRKFDDLSQIYQGLASQDEDQAIETLRRIRAGHQVESILRHVSQREDESEFEQHRRLFLTALAQSTAALDDIVNVASSVLLVFSSRVNLPLSATYEPLKNTLVTMGDLHSILPGAPSRGLPLRIPDGTNDGPIFWVPAAPWTTMTDNDEAVSHLVSLFLCFINPFWRLVEEDAFLRAMRSRKHSVYCSSLLVHSILACASIFSEVEEAFASPGKMLTRGEHFHREALRLLEVEDQKATIVNLQSMLIISVESTRRGKDKLGLDLAYRAGALVKSLPNPDRGSGEVAQLLATRVRACLVSSVIWLNLAFIHGLCLDSDTLSLKVQDGIIDVPRLLPDSTAHWTGFPLTREPLPFKINLLLHERTRLVPIIADLVRPYGSGRTKKQILDDASAVAWRLHEWHEALPDDLVYAKRMPSPLFEFHCHFVDLNMELYGRALKSLSECNDDHAGLPDDVEQLKSRSVTWAHRSATIARDFREAYGYKIVPPFLIHMATVANLTLLRSMEVVPTTTSLSRPKLGGRMSDAEREEVDMSFAECFRCLLAAGLQEMHARGSARMVYCTALELKVRLPDSVQQMISLVAECAWQPSDLHQLSSAYPNWGLVNHGESNMEQILRKWDELAIEDQTSVASSEAGVTAAA